MQIECFFHLVRKKHVMKKQNSPKSQYWPVHKNNIFACKKGSMSDGNKNYDSRQFRLTQLPYATVLQQSRKRKWDDLMA